MARHDGRRPVSRTDQEPEKRTGRSRRLPSVGWAGIGRRQLGDVARRPPPRTGGAAPGSRARSAPADGPRSGCRRAPTGRAARRRRGGARAARSARPPGGQFEIVDADQPLVALRASAQRADRQSAARRPTDRARPAARVARPASARAAPPPRSGRPRRSALRARRTRRSTSSTCGERREQPLGPLMIAELVDADRLVGVEGRVRPGRRPRPRDRRQRILEAAGVDQGDDQLAPQEDVARRRRQRALERGGDAARGSPAVQRRLGQIGVALDPARIAAPAGRRAARSPPQAPARPGSPRSGRAAPNRARSSRSARS